MTRGNPPESTRDALEMRVIILPPTRADGAAIGKLLSAAQLPYGVVRNMTELCHLAASGAGTLMVGEEALLGDPDPLFAYIAQQPMWSDVPVIVLSRTGREAGAFANILSCLGNVSVIERPVRISTLLSHIHSSHRARTRQYQLREFLVEQERAQRAVREAESRYRSLLENLTDYAIFMTDRAGRIVTWNLGAQSVLGYTAEEAIGHSTALFAAAKSDSGNILEKDLEEARTLGRSTSAGWKIRKDRKRLFVDGVVIAVRDERGELTGFAFFLRDITEKHLIESDREQLLKSERTARSEAERASRMKDEFLATLSHELRTPLNAVLGWTQLMMKCAAVPEEVSKGLSVIERNARIQAQIIADLLDMSSIISGKVRLAVQRVALAAVVNATVEAVRPTAEAKSIRLQVVLDPLAGPVRGDPNRLQQVLWNLLTNAVKFTPRYGRITVTLARINSQLEVEVTDTGEGIDPAFLPYVFDRFRQADSSSARRHGGLGLGLSIVKQLVELHGGTISASSPGRGAGSTFRFVLPLMPTNGDTVERGGARDYSKGSVEAPSLQALERVSLKGVSVLVVDDEPDSRSLIQRVLEECEAQVWVAASAGEALEKVTAYSPQVLVSDIGMPHHDGYELIQQVRALGTESAHLQAIALTAYARVEDRLKAIRAGFQLHLSKPVEPVELISMIQSLIRRPVRP